MKYTKDTDNGYTLDLSQVQDSYVTQFEIELDFSDNFSGQESFFATSEKDFNQQQTVSLLFCNKYLPAANLVTIHCDNQMLTYQLSLVLFYKDWSRPRALNECLQNIMQLFECNGISVEIESEDMTGYYLRITERVKPGITLGERIEDLSKRMALCIDLAAS